MTAAGPPMRNVTCAAIGSPTLIFGTNDFTKRIEKRLARHPFLFGHTNLLIEGVSTSSKGASSSAQPTVQHSQIIVAALAQARRSSPKTHRQMLHLLNATST